MNQALYFIYFMMYFCILGDKCVFLGRLYHNVSGMAYGGVIFTEDQKIEHIRRSFAYCHFSKFRNQPRDRKQKYE